MRRFLLEAIVFVTGACALVLEILGARMLAPYLGSSLYVWTALIATVLGALSIGYWWGGRLAGYFAPLMLSGSSAMTMHQLRIMLRNLLGEWSGG